MIATRILIVADDALVRAGLATLLADLPNLHIAGRTSSLEDLPAAVQAHQADVVLWDMGWKPDVALARLYENRLRVPIVALVEDEADARQAWQGGARGVLRRETAPATLAAALQAAASKLIVLDPAYNGLLRSAPPVRPESSSLPAIEDPLVEELTPRELEVLRLLAEGLPNKAIAQRLDISEHTVKFHVNALLGKLGVASRTEAVVRATRLGLIFL